MGIAKFCCSILLRETIRFKLKFEDKLGFIEMIIQGNTIFSKNNYDNKVITFRLFSQFFAEITVSR